MIISFILFIKYYYYKHGFVVCFFMPHTRYIRLHNLIISPRLPRRQHTSIRTSFLFWNVDSTNGDNTNRFEVKNVRKTSIRI